ncbi:hypothetical protein K435DRAFT_810584 [Dendrothele bispora CBS 962.96]|uniref:KOW domain-containing protein n=1 Tax=Dendrothele bispora (strain CBS 962.96) TaxID=1314807 RepID=A0A4S8KUX9_DENBC|nr:hypothetical protein K435DRAFT_810584 [Dendrothele bispora CBS 962.96]
MTAGSPSFNVDPNLCRKTKARNDVTVPWINRHVTVCVGQYRGYTGVIRDVLPPRPADTGYTRVDIKIIRLNQIIRFRHDDVIDTAANKTLREAFPLGPHQHQFWQSSWDVAFAPNVQETPIDPHTKLPLQVQDFLTRQPPEPWLHVKVKIVKGSYKSEGWITMRGCGILELVFPEAIPSNDIYTAKNGRSVKNIHHRSQALYHVMESQPKKGQHEISTTGIPASSNDPLRQSSFPTGTRLFSEQTVQASMQTGVVENTATGDAAEHVEMREMAETAEDVGNSNAKHVSGDA